MSTTIPLGRVRGTAIRLHPSGLLLAAGFTAALALIALPVSAPGHTAAGYWLVAAVLGPLLTGSVLAHELGHALAGNALGFPARRITLSWQGGLTEHDGDPPDPRAEFLVTAAGPAATLAVTICCAVVAGLCPVLGLSTLPSAGVLVLGAINAVLLVANLLPGTSLDGGQLLAAWCWRRCGDQARGRLVVRRTALLLGPALAAIGAVLCWTWYPQAGLALVAAGWLVAEPRLSPRTWSRPGDFGPWPRRSRLGNVEPLPPASGHPRGDDGQPCPAHDRTAQRG